MDGQAGGFTSEVVITPEMLSAGYEVYADCLADLETGDVSGEEMLRRAFEVMSSVAGGKRLAPDE